MSYQEETVTKEVIVKHEICDGPRHDEVGNKLNASEMYQYGGGIQVSGGYSSPIDMLVFHFCDFPCLLDWANTPKEERNKWYSTKYSKYYI